MKSMRLPRSAMWLVLVGLSLLAVPARSQDPSAAGENFPGVRQALTPEQYAAAGVAKLSPEERAKLDEYLRGYFTGATQRVAQKAAASAVDVAVKTHRVEPPELIESKIVGTVDGWKSGTIFILENGQHWKSTDNEHRYFPPVTNPDVFLVKDFFGYKLAIAGGGVTRVIRTR